jgi:succinyl-CoA synthetase beta subunit
MKIHEYQAKAILRKYGVTVPRGAMAATRDEAETVAKELFDSGATGVVVKAQIHAGGRGKGGGVKIAKSVAEAGELAAKMLGMKLVTHPGRPYRAPVADRRNASDRERAVFRDSRRPG